MSEMRYADSVLLSALADSIHGKTPQFPDDCNCDEVFSEALSQGVLPLIYGGEFHSEKDFSRSVLSCSIKGLAVEKQHANIHRILTKANIPYVILKGCASGYYYPDPSRRCYGDVDFLIPSEYKEKTSSVLLDEGFADEKHGNAIHDLYSFMGCRFEMHTEPAGIPNVVAGDRIRDSLKRIITDNVEVDTEFGKIRIPSAFHHGLVLLLHTAHHLTAEGIGLRQLCDWAVFMESFSEEEFLLIFKDKLLISGLWEFTTVLCACCSTYLGCKEFFFTKSVNPDIVNSLIDDILSGGNFGQKDTDRAHEAMLISDHAKNGVGNKSKLSQFVQSSNSIVYKNWKISKKIKVLLPFGWLYFGGRYIIRSLAGKRPAINIADTINSADKRIELYKNFHLYETGVIDGE